MSNIFVTGGLGFIGSHSVELLADSGHKVYVYDKRRHDNILDYNRLRSVMYGFRPDAVLHLAANSSLQKSVENPVYDATNNIIGTLNVIEAAKENEVKRIVFASSTSVYGPSAIAPYQETYKPAPSCPYGVSKLACEMYLELSGISYASLRYANVYGPGQKPLGESILIARALDHMTTGAEFWINGDGWQVRDWIYVKDVAKANLFALEGDACGSFNVGSGNGVSVNEIIDAIKAEIRFMYEIEHRPTITWEPRMAVLAIQKIYNEIGWKAETPVGNGIKETVTAWINQ